MNHFSKIACAVALVGSSLTAYAGLGTNGYIEECYPAGVWDGSYESAANATRQFCANHQEQYIGANVHISEAIYGW